MEKSEGDKIEPWGSPDVSGAAEEVQLPILTEKYLSDKKDLNQLRTEPFIPKWDCNLDKTNVWLTVSKAADKSRRTRITESPASVAV